MEKVLVMTFDIGTTACKGCLYSIGDQIEKIADQIGEYPLITLEDGGVEQEVDAWWGQICKCSNDILAKTNTSPEQVQGISFCCQMQATIMVDKEGKALMNPMIWLDARSTEQIDRELRHGIKIEGINAFKLLKSLNISGGIAGTAKDPVWKYMWIKENKPDVFAKTYKWLDVKDYLELRCTGEFKQTYDSAHLTWCYDTRPEKLGWSKSLCKMFKVNMDHLPEVVKSTDKVGGLTEQAAKELGLVVGTPIFGGGGDASLIGIGAGCVELYDTYCYVGTSGWIVSNFDQRKVDISNFIASLLGAIPGFYNYIAEQETAGVCLQWVRDHLALDEIGLYLKAQHIVDLEDKYDSLYDYLNEVVISSEPGSKGVIFTPWLHGNRAPREDPFVRGMFFNIGLDTGKRDLIRSVLEGVSFHMRWMLEAAELTIPRQNTIRFVGGGAKSEPWCQIMADILQRDVETIYDPLNTGAVGAAMCCAIGLGVYSNFQTCKNLIPVKQVYHPNPANKEIYNRNFEVFVELYSSNKKLYKNLNEKKK